MFAGGEVDRLKDLRWYPGGEFLGYSKRGQKSDPDEKGIVTSICRAVVASSGESEK